MSSYLLTNGKIFTPRALTFDLTRLWNHLQFYVNVFDSLNISLMIMQLYSLYINFDSMIQFEFTYPDMICNKILRILYYVYILFFGL